MKRIMRQQGFVVPLLLIIGVTAVAAFFFSQRSNYSYETKRARQTTAALAEAKAALLAYAAGNDLSAADKLYGVLPCPDRGQPLTNPLLYEGGESGVCDSAFESSLGRLPWYSLDVGRLADGDNECLWYAVSGNHKKDLFKANHTFFAMLNEDTPALLRAVDEHNNFVGGDTEIVAIVMAPGDVIGLQDRSKSVTHKVNLCSGNYTAANYLDSFNKTGLVINNAVTNAVPKAVSTFIQAPASATFNDRLVAITRKELFDAVAKRKDFYDKATSWPTKVALTLANCVRNEVRKGAPSITGLPPAPSGPPQFPPRPAAVNLGVAWDDYADPNNYGSQAGALSGRFPALWMYDPTSTQAKPYTATSVMDYCTPASTEYEIYKHWKDHFFYVLSAAFANASGTNTITCSPTNCITVNGGVTQYAAIVIFSGMRLASQNHTGVALGDITQYLEGRNASNHPNAGGNGDYQSDSATSNDVLICIPTDLTQPAAVCP